MTRLNYTNRLRLTRDRIRLRLHESEGQLLLNVERLDLSGFALPADAKVVVEAYRQTTRSRIRCGTVGSPVLPTTVPMPEFSVDGGALFRVKVVGVGEADGKLLAVADRVPATGEQDGAARTPLLPFRSSDDLGQRLWRLEIDEGPAVLINSGVGDWKAFALEPSFQALVFPEILRQVSLWMVRENDINEEDGDEAAAWRRFLANLGFDPADVKFDEPEQTEQWADDVAAAFARKHKFLHKLNMQLDAEAAAP